MRAWARAGHEPKRLLASEAMAKKREHWKHSCNDSSDSESPVQTLVQVCTQQLSGRPYTEPGHESLDAITNALHHIVPEHCGLQQPSHPDAEAASHRTDAWPWRRAGTVRALASSVASAFAKTSSPRKGATVSSQEVFADPMSRFRLEIFMLPEGTQLPVHDHPGMSVVSKLLYGCVRVRKFAWLDDATACLVQEDVLQQGDFAYLFPERDGNLHEITAYEESAFFDVLTPPYDPTNGRGCTQFKAETLTATHSHESSSNSSFDGSSNGNLSSYPSSDSAGISAANGVNAPTFRLTPLRGSSTVPVVAEEYNGIV